MSLAGGFVDVSSGLCDPVMLQVSPMTTHRIAMNGANMVVSSHHRTGQTFQNDAESSRRDVKGAGLEPDTIRIRNPETVIFQVDVSDEVFAASSIRIETVAEIAEGSYRHRSFQCTSGWWLIGLAGVISFRQCQAPAKLLVSPVDRN